ncbi:MAG: MMPL family transporter [Gammaproteobacteria bacterium]
MRFRTQADASLDRILSAWVLLVIRFPRSWILIILLLTLGCGYYSFNDLGVNTDTNGMLAADLPFKQDRDRLNRLFPEDSRAIWVVIEGATPEITGIAVKALQARLQDDRSIVESVFSPSHDSFFEREGLLYPDMDDLDRVVMDISRAQPFLGRLSRDNTLDELLNLLNQALEQQSGGISGRLNQIFGELSASVEAALEGREYSVSWQRQLLGGEPIFNQSLGFILVRPHFDYSDFIPARHSFESIRSIAREFEKRNAGVRIRLTGEVALEHEELQSLSQGTEIAGSVSFVLVTIALLCGLRSVKLAGATLFCLVTGLVLSAGFATLAVGHLNLISISFAVLYIGLGVDYAIHLALRFEDLVRSGVGREHATRHAVRFVGPSIILCTLTTAIGFYAFIPTAYDGVSELGVISGTAMFIGLFVTLTLLPALFVIVPFDAQRFISPAHLLPAPWYTLPLRYSRWVRVGTLVLVVGGTWSLRHVAFDFDPVSLRDQKSESVTTFRDLLQQKTTSPMVISVLADNHQEVVEKAARLEKLDSVAKVMSIFDLIPHDQQKKIELVRVLDESLGPMLDNFRTVGSVDVERNIRGIEKLIANLEVGIGEDAPPNASDPVRRSLDERLKQLRDRLEGADPQQKQKLLARIQHSMLNNLAQTVHDLRLALEPSQIQGIGDIPNSIVRRWVSLDGIFRVLVFPKKDLNNQGNLKEFVEEVRKIDPRASGLPVFYSESGKEVVKAFRQALTYAVGAIILVSYLALQNLKETLFVLFPLLLASILTGASTVIFDNPFNFANIIVLPVLLGLGIDSSIHVVHRLRIMPDQKQDILRTSTARGIFFSGLTTVMGFTSLALISHAGIASLGLLLTIGIVLTLFCTLIVLPAFAVGKFNNNVV